MEILSREILELIKRPEVRAAVRHALDNDITYDNVIRVNISNETEQECIRLRERIESELSPSGKRCLKELIGILQSTK